MKTSKLLAGAMVAAVALVAGTSAAERSMEKCSPGTVESYIESHKKGVEELCWDPIKTKPEAPAQVNATFRVIYNAKGQVESASVIKGFDPHVVPCIAGRLRNWTPPCGPGSLEVTFVWKK